MPVEFLADEQAAAYGTFREMPTRPELERFFFLDDDDRDLVALRRADHHRLGMALQICTVRYVGLFLLEDPLDVPWPVVEYLAGQLGIAEASCVKRYTERRPTAYEHSWEIRRRFGYHEFEECEWGRKFRAFLHGRAWTHPEGPVALFNHSVAWLRRNRVLLPGVSVLARQVSEVRAATERRLHTTVARRADPALPAALSGLLAVPEGARLSELERLRRPPTRSMGTAMARALERVEEISSFRLGRVNLSRRRVGQRPLLPREIDAGLVPAVWRKAVFANANLPEGAVDRDAYVVCVLEQLPRALNRRDVFAAPSQRRRCAGQTRGPDSWTGPGGRPCAPTCWPA